MALTLLRLIDLPHPLVDRWDRWVESEHATFHQTQGVTTAWEVASPGAVVLAVNDHVIASFRQDNDRFVGLMGATPTISQSSGTDPAVTHSLLQEIVSSYPGMLVYLPLVDGRWLRRSGLSDAETWRRLPNPVIGWDYRGGDLIDRVVDRLGNRVQRRWRAFERASLECHELSDDAALVAVLAIEEASWKAAYGLALHQNPLLLEFYTALLLNSLVSVQVVVDDTHPVAYRLDAYWQRTVSCLKWSYDDSYAGVSPGFYLLTKGLRDRWGHIDLSHVDLCGSPDPLKTAIASTYQDRWDVAWPAGERAKAIMRERQAHDAKLETNFRAGAGYKKIYGR